MESIDKLIIETKGEKLEIPLHMVKIELHKGWGKNEGSGPELVIRAIGADAKETEKWAESYAKICWGQ